MQTSHMTGGTLWADVFEGSAKPHWVSQARPAPSQGSTPGVTSPVPALWSQWGTSLAPPKGAAGLPSRRPPGLGDAAADVLSRSKWQRLHAGSQDSESKDTLLCRFRP